MFGKRFTRCGLTATSLLLFAVLAVPRPAATQEACVPDFLPNPYVFILLDTSGSMNYSPPCTQVQLDAGQCSFLCPTGDCYVPLQGDDPASKLFQIKEALYSALENRSDVQFGFAAYNQDALKVEAKHWLYQAQGNGPVLPPSALIPAGPYPTAGAQEVFGALWGCDTGSGDNDIGCYATSPADLPDAWETGRVQRLPKGGKLFNQSVTFYIRKQPTVYKVTYVPTGTSALGSLTLNVNVKIDRCNNSNCSSWTLIGQQTVAWSRIDQFLSWDNGSSASLNRTNPELTYFTNTATDALSSNWCSGWEPNTDTSSDLSSGYNLRWPTDSSDSRGPAFYEGDVIPFDWLDDQRQDVLTRLAPNLATGALTPDFRISAYFRDLPLGVEQLLRLKDERVRPLIPLGNTPLAESLASFRSWFVAWNSVAYLNDPDWYCRGKFLIILTDNPQTTCNGADACAEAATLYNTHRVKTIPIGFGAPSTGAQQLPCIAANGGSINPYYPQTKQELIDTLNGILDAITP